VTGVSSTRNLELVRSLGADHVVDYTKQDYTAGAERYDLILDNVGNRTLSENRRVLAPTGRYVLVGGGGPDAGNWIAPMVKPLQAILVSPFVSQDMGMFLAKLTKEDTERLAELMSSGTVTPVIDRRYALSEAAEAIRYLEGGRARGKVVVTVE
jgi:NADPH:quinone reductase-like Zn-dependent oxidoreductase